MHPKHNYYRDVPVEDFRNIPSDAYITGYWHDKGYYAGYEDDIRREFRFRSPLPVSCGPVADAIRTSGNPVALHVRRGDYVGHPDLDGVVGREYYIRALKYLRQRLHGEITVFVFSDDVEWCHSELRSDEVEMFYVGPEYTGGEAEYDLHLMTLCRHFVIANSSFSFWGAWLAPGQDKIVVAPAHWKHGQQYDKKPVIPDEWTTL